MNFKVIESDRNWCFSSLSFLTSVPTQGVRKTTAFMSRIRRIKVKTFTAAIKKKPVLSKKVKCSKTTKLPKKKFVYNITTPTPAL